MGFDSPSPHQINTMRKHHINRQHPHKKLKTGKAKARREKWLERLAETYRRGSSECYMCGGEMSWCSFCDCWTSDCCQDWGTCACS